MSKTSSSAPPFNGANSNRIQSSRLSDDYYDFKPRLVYSSDSSGNFVLTEIPASEYLGTVDDFSLSNMLAAGLSPQAVSSPIGSRLDGLSELIDFNNNNPETDKTE